MKIESLFDTPEKRGRLLRYFWIISLLMLLLGFFFIFLFWDTGI